MYSRINMEIAICDDDELFNEIMSEKLSTVLNKNQINMLFRVSFIKLTYIPQSMQNCENVL